MSKLVYMSPFWILMELRMMEVMVTHQATGHAKLQSSCHLQHTSTHISTGRMPITSFNQQSQSSEGKKYHVPRTCSPQAHLEIFHPGLAH